MKKFSQRLTQCQRVTGLAPGRFEWECSFSDRSSGSQAAVGAAAETETPTTTVLIGRRRVRQAVCGCMLGLWLVTGWSESIQAENEAAVDVDVLLHGGTIVDGTGRPQQVGHIGLKGERIVGVGEFPLGTVGRTIDCTGLLVAPGFIDLHTHSDDQVVSRLLRASINYVIQGCTTQVTGNCGSGPVDVAKYYAAIDQGGAGTNVAHLIPQGSLREAVVGNVDRPATPDELQSMVERVQQGMQDGAWGLSTGLIYVPSVYATTEELVALCRPVAQSRGIYASHIRGEGSELLAAVTEALSIGRDAGLPVHVSHFKASGIPNWGSLRLAADLIERARQNGQAATADQYPYTASSTSLEATVIPTWARSGGSAELLRRLDDPTDGPRLKEQIQQELQEKRDGAAIYLARCRYQPQWIGKNLVEIASATGQTPMEVTLQIVRHGGAAIVHFSMSEDDVRMAMSLPWVATASDGRAYLPGGDRPHPRSYGTFARKIGYYALQEQVLPVEQAIRSASGLPAEILGLQDRGLLQPGMYADVVVLDPKTYRDQATFDDPHRYATGCEYVFVNGQPAVHQGQPTGALAGRALRHAAEPTSTGSQPKQP
jgi:N-acyl-D-amino-acid deacylase